MTEQRTAETRRYLVLLPGPEDDWAALPEAEQELGMANHRRFHERLAARGHRIVTAAPLEHTRLGVSMRNTGRGQVTVTDGPFAEATEQVLGFYLLESADEADLLSVVREFAAGGDHVELRRLAADGDEPAPLTASLG